MAKERKQREAPAQNKLDAIGIEAICEQMAECKSLRVIAQDAEVGLGTLTTWLAKYPEQYARARDAQAERFAEEIIQIADDGRNDTYQTENGPAVDHDVIARSRLRVDARKWLASKMAPKKYGDKVTQELTGAEGGPIAIQSIKRVIVDPRGTGN